MKTAIYIEKGTTQLVLTPENDFDRHVVAEVLRNQNMNITFNQGSFYECNGGWIRQASATDSLIMRFGKLE